jgi:hypothetical protein
MFVSDARAYRSKAPTCFSRVGSGLTLAGKVFQVQTLQLITNVGKLRPQKVLKHWALVQAGLGGAGVHAIKAEWAG